MVDLHSFSIGQLESTLAAWGFKPSHAARILRSFFAHGGSVNWDSLRLPAGLRARLEDSISPPPVAIAARQESDDGTTKLLLRLADGRTIESVLMPDYRPDRAAGCISSQVGCAMGCDFCATAQNGFERNLTIGEIVGQFLALRREAIATGRRLQTLVFMGMGEPMLNLGNVLTAIDRIASNKLGALGCRQITVSTVGIIPGIDALTAANPGIHLAVSLHAPDDATRARLLPAGKRFNVADILAAADRYQATSGRPLTIQYCLLRGVNDSPAQARDLAALLAGRRMHVNLLRYNPTGLSLRGVAYETTDDATAETFIAEVRAGGAVAHFRRPRGRDIDAACGQLRGRGGSSPRSSLAPQNLQ
ncbi:MAG TPA: 23S rRNA (adenine(2503)-C(2))-methyltransferase RlmN [Opitutaceae bacterium]|nr:23S rRNA (adenine(2503)-C(2))-methyltransferase RlmN [Opitutaceae bacterium]